MIVQKLQNIGLTKNESIIYETLLRTGLSKSGKILKESRLTTGKIYEILEGLKNKGLVSESIINHVKHFKAASPNNLLDYTAKKRQELDIEEQVIRQLIPELDNISMFKQLKTDALVYTGIRGMRVLTEEIFRDLNSDDKIYTLSVSGDKKNAINLFWLNYNKRTGEKGIVTYFLCTENKSEYYKALLSKKHNKIKLLPFSTKIPVVVYGKYHTVIINYDSNPITAIDIIDEYIANSFIEIFKTLYRLAK